MILRHPIDRLYSHYLLHCREDKERKRNVIPLQRYLDILIESHDYYQSLKMILAHFPKEQLLLIKSEDFYADVNATCSKIFTFMGLPPHMIDCYIKHQKSTNREHDVITENLHKKLITRFEPMMETFYQLLKSQNINFDPWDLNVLRTTIQKCSKSISHISHIPQKIQQRKEKIRRLRRLRRLRNNTKLTRLLMK